MNLLLIRHGETPLNIRRVLQPADTPLSERGQAQAAALARRVAGLGLAGIVSSDLPRARQTAEHVARATGLPIATTPLLQERNFGELRGLAYDQFAHDPLQLQEAPPGGESMREFEQRVALAFAHLLQMQLALNGPLAVVTHGLVVKSMLGRHALLVAGQLLPAAVRNASLTIVGAASPHRVDLLDCTVHLDAGLAAAAGSLSGG